MCRRRYSRSNRRGLRSCDVSWLTLARPLFRNRTSRGDIVHHQDQLMVVVAVEHLDIHARLRHAAHNLAELSGLRLTQSLDQYFAFDKHADTGGFQRPAGSGAILEQKVRGAYAVYHPGATSFDAHSGAPECLPHFGEGSRTIVQKDGEVGHDRSILQWGGAFAHTHHLVSCCFSDG